MKKKTSGLTLTPGSPFGTVAEKWIEGTKDEPIVPPVEVVHDTPIGDAAALGQRAARPKRLTIDIPPDLHRKLKLKSVMEGVQMADLLRDWIREKCA